MGLVGIRRVAVESRPPAEASGTGMAGSIGQRRQAAGGCIDCPVGRPDGPRLSVRLRDPYGGDGRVPWWASTTCWCSIGFYMIAGSIIGARISRFIRHPQLTAIKLWAVAHLLVNGDLASLTLFGGLLIWAVLAVMLINRQEEASGARAGPDRMVTLEAGALSAAIVIYGLVGYAHGWLGYPVHG